MAKLENNKAMNNLFDQRNSDWYFDKLVQFIVFISGISAIVFVIGIFVFVTIEGMGFLFESFSFSEFFGSQYWEPSDEDDPEYGILALIAGTASVTGLAMLVEFPFHWEQQSILQNFQLEKPESL